MEREEEQPWARVLWIASGVVLAAAVLAIVTYLGAPVTVGAATPTPVMADCDMIELPDEHDDAYVRFTLINAVDVDVTAVKLRIYDQGWIPGDMVGRPAHVTLHWRIPAKGTITRADTVKGPPHYHNGKFDQAGCTVEGVVFEDGSTWP